MLRFARLLAGLLALISAAAAQTALPSDLPDLRWHVAARPWTTLDTPHTDPLDKVEAIVAALAPLQYWNAADPGDVQDGGDTQNGSIIDPFNLREHQYATPYYAFAVAAAVSEGRVPALLESGARALDHATADIAGLDGSAQANDSHGEFFGAPMMKALRLYKQLAAAHPTVLTPTRIARWEARLRTSRTAYMNNGVGQNWRTYGMKGEWLRVQDGLVPRTAGTGASSYQGVSYIEWYWNNEQRARFSRDRDQFLLNPWFLMYHDDDTNSRQNFAYHGGAVGNLLDLVRNGYDGPSRQDLLDTLQRAGRSSLLTMSANGDAPAAGRTGNHVWNDIVYGNAYDQLAELAHASGDALLAGRYRRAARLAFRSAWRFQQEQGWFSVTKSLLPPAHKNVYFSWSALTNYNGYVEIHSAEAAATRLSGIPEQAAPAEIGGYAFNLDSQFATAFANAGGMQLQLCTRGSSQSANDLSGGINCFALGIVRFSRPDWDSRLGPADGWMASNWSQAISFAPTFLENGAWKLLSELPDRYAGVFTPEFVHPLLVRATLSLTPKAGQSGPAFSLGLVLTPDGVLIDTARTAGSESFGVTWPVLEFDGKHVLDRTTSAAVATTAFPRQTGAPQRFEAESAALSGGVAVANSAPGFTGAGYAAFPASGGSIQWANVPGGDGGSATIGFRYTLSQAAASARELTLVVNGVPRAVPFVHTGNASSYGGGVLAFPLYWHQVHVPVSLLPGSVNTVRLEAVAGSGLNVDELRVFPAVAAAPEPDQQAFIALGSAPVIDTSTAVRRTAYGDQRPVRVTQADAPVATFVYPRKAGDPSAEAVRASFVRDTEGFTSALGRVRGDTYVGRTSAGGRAASLDLDQDGQADIQFDQVCSFVARLENGLATVIEADRPVRCTYAGRTVRLAAFTPVVWASADQAWHHLAVPASGRRFELIADITPPNTDAELVAGFVSKGIDADDRPTLGLRFSPGGQISPLDLPGRAPLACAAGVPHRLRLLVDLADRTYSLWCKPAGAPERRLLLAAPLPDAVRSAADLALLAWRGPADAASLVSTREYARPFSVKINFQDATSAGYPGYLADTGAAYGDRGNGHAYGWIEGANTTLTRNRNSSASPDERYDTLNQLQYNNPPTETHTWEIAVPAGYYDVRLVCGDPGYTDSYYHVLAEGVSAVQGNAQGAARNFFEGTSRVLVTDGRLTLTNGAGAYRNKVCFIEITSTADLPYPYTSYNDWAAARYGSSTGANALPTSDPDGDGRANLLDYATGAPDSQSVFSASADAGGSTALRFRHSATALQASCRVSRSDDLATWTPVWSGDDDADFTSASIVSAADWVTLRFPSPAAGGRHFYRFEVSAP